MPRPRRPLTSTTDFAVSSPGIPTPSRLAATQALAAIRPDAYARTRNHVTGAVTGLSPYLTHGVLTPRQALADILSQQPLSVGHKLVNEFGWRAYCRHVWSHEGDGIFQSLHPGPMPDDHYAPELPSDIRHGTTGVPVIDEAVRTLYTCGTLHNHARMWLASYVVHIRHVHWRVGADWLVAHLLDGDLASNHLSWQWVAGTASRKPYLFNADNVAQFAPPRWHSPASVIDQTYEALDALARGLGAAASPTYPPSGLQPRDPLLSVDIPVLTTPPSDLGVGVADSILQNQVQGREVWLVHPWALRAPPADLTPDAVVIGVYPREFHAAWPWSETRWRWVDAAMREVTTHRCHLSAAELAASLKSAACVRSVADPHITRWMGSCVQLDPEPALFPGVEKRCQSFSQWWTRATRGYRQAEELL